MPEHKKAIQDTYVAQYKENIAKGTAEIHRNTNIHTYIHTYIHIHRNTEKTTQASPAAQ